MTTRSIIRYIKNTLEAGNKASSSRLFMIATLMISIVLYTIVAVILVYDLLDNGTVDTDLDALSHFITAVAVNLGVGGLTKVISKDRIRKEEEHDECTIPDPD